MKKLMIVVGLVVGLTSSFALAEPDCNDYKQFSKLLRAATDYISSTKGDFSDNAQLEADMDELMGVLEAVASSEGDAGFSSAVGNMSKIWSKKTWSGADVDRFKQAFDAASVALDRVAKKRCNS
ncbi:MAG: hypothetical protein HQL60_05915 [Magnetococcales bacterium]|nr:hypothetical protein [Magnetococcales bacterium]